MTGEPCNFRDSKELQLPFSLHITAILAKIFCQFVVFPWKFEPLQIKQGLISSSITLLYELSHELLNNVRLKILAKQEMIANS